jgi:hypothetical protein
MDQISNIPVLLNFNPGEKIGFGELNDKGELVITVKKDSVNDFVSHHAKAGRIFEIHVGFGYPSARRDHER